MNAAMIFAGLGQAAQMANPTQPECLPSGNAALQLMRGDWTALPAVAATTALRGGLVAGGLYVAGARGDQLWKYTLGATLAIEVFVLGWAAWQVWK